MNFKNRTLEENDSSKMARNLALGGLGGAALGGLYNMATNGAEDLQGERTQELANWFNNNAREELGAAGALDKDTYTDLRDAIIHQNLPSFMKPISWGTGHTEDMGLFNSDNENEIAIQRILKAHPEIKLYDQPGIMTPRVTVGDHEINFGLRSDDEYSDYKSEKILDALKANDKELQQDIQKTPELAIKQGAMIDNINNAVKDSYINKALIGAGLGAGVGFAKRKLDQKYNREG